MRVYNLTISTPEGVPFIKLSEKDNYQIVASISTTDISATNTYNVIEIYNANSIFSDIDLKDYQIVLECGYEEDGISKLQGFDTKKIMKKPILKGFIWDVMNDFSSPPQNKTILRTRPFSLNKVNTNTTGKTISIIYKKNTYLFDFVKDVLNQYGGMSIEPMIESIRTISNKTNDIVFQYNPNSSDLIKQLDNFIQKEVNKQGLILGIFASTSGYVLGYNIRSSLPSDIQNEIKQSFATLPQNILDTQMIIKPPSFLNATTMQVQTILLPSIKVGTILNIKDEIAVKKTTDSKFQLEQKATGYWYVKSVSYNVSIYDSAPAAYSNIMELIKIDLK